MFVPAGLARNDEAVRSLVDAIRQTVADYGLQRDRRTGDWFSSSQLDNVRRVLETRGYEVCQQYVAGKLERGSPRWEQQRWRALRSALQAGARSNLEITVVSYIVGKLNQVISNEEETNARGAG